jgi:hypothetical protein
MDDTSWYSESRRIFSDGKKPLARRTIKRWGLARTYLFISFLWGIEVALRDFTSFLLLPWYQIITATCGFAIACIQ